MKRDEYTHPRRSTNNEINRQKHSISRECTFILVLLDVSDKEMCLKTKCQNVFKNQNYIFIVFGALCYAHAS